MDLIGYMDSPFVRRVAVTAQFLDIPFVHKELSIFRQFDDFRKINPLVKVPTVITDQGQVLVESTLIIDYLESLADKRLMPDTADGRIAALRSIGAALIAMEKVVQLIYETKQRPAEMQYAPWIERVEKQLRAAVDQMETSVGDGSGWLVEDVLGQADISTAIAWRFVQREQPGKFVAENYPGLSAFSARAESLPEFIACPMS